MGVKYYQKEKPLPWIFVRMKACDTDVLIELIECYELYAFNISYSLWLRTNNTPRFFSHLV